jgi:hypothetical protein
MADAEDEAAEATAIFCANLSRAVLLAVAEMRAGNVDFALRILEVFEARIKRGVARVEAERDARATRH